MKSSFSSLDKLDRPIFTQVTNKTLLVICPSIATIYIYIYIYDIGQILF
jgi:hypothetical protein